MFQYLTSAAVAALREVGMAPAPDVGGRIGRALKLSVEQYGMNRTDLMKALEQTLSLAGTDHANWGSLATWPAAA